MTLSDLQADLRHLLRGLEHPPLGSGVALAEECGEVNQLLLDHHAYGKPLRGEALSSELADVLICLCEIASQHGLDLEAGMSRRLEKLREQAPRWREDLGPALRRARGEA